MKKLIIVLLIIFLFSCGNDDIKAPQEIEYIVELFNCDGTINKTYEAVDIVRLNPELKIELIDGTIIYITVNWIATKQTK